MTLLSYIYLQNSFSVSDGGLAALARLSSLCSLNLKGCREISDFGLAALEPLSRLTLLRIQVSNHRPFSEADGYNWHRSSFCLMVGRLKNP
jgi:hypothetical protein